MFAVKEGFGYADLGYTRGYFYSEAVDAAKGREFCSIKGKDCSGYALLYSLLLDIG